MADSTASNLKRTTVLKYEKEAKDMVRGTATFIPNPNIDMGKIYNLQGLGAFFNGNYYCVNITHTFDNNGYTQQGEFIKQFWDGAADISVDSGVLENPRSSKPVVSPKSNQRTYVVAEGDTLWSIAKRFYSDPTKWKIIEDANYHYLTERDKRDSDGSGHWIYPSMKLIIP